MAQTVKHLPTIWETRVQSLGREDLLEKEMAPHSSILASSQVGMGMSGNFLSFIKGVENRFKFQEGMWEFSCDPAMGKGLISR